jgi:HlyD family secretion protein
LSGKESEMNAFDEDLVANTASIRHLMRWFVLSALVVCLSVGGWAFAAKIDSAVVTSGVFEVKSNAQAVQHLEGGVVGAILVKNGEVVTEGQVLVRLDAAKVIADTSIVERKLIDLTAQKARLEAERSDKTTVDRPASPVDSTGAQATLDAALAAQQNILIEKKSARESQLSQLAEKKRQTETEIQGLQEQLAASQGEMEQAAGDLQDKLVLNSKGLIRRPVLRQAERDVSRLKGEIGEAQARVAGAQSQLSETEFKIAEVTRSARSDILTQLQDVTARIAEAEQEMAAARDRLDRLEIRAPRTGRVHELAIHTVGGIIGPGQTVMSIIPNNDPLVVSAKIRPDDIDQVRVGQPATVRISSFHMATPPELEGKVTNVSADQVKDDHSGMPYFTVSVAVAPEEEAKLEGHELTPGLPAEVLLRGESRRVITYLTQPLTDKIGLAFREK